MPQKLILFKKNLILRNISIVLFLIFSCGIKAQKKTKDSLLLQIQFLRNKNPQVINNKVYVDLLNDLAKQYRYRNADSIKLLSDESFLISSKIDYKKGVAFALLRRGDYYSDSGLEQKAFEVYGESKVLAFSLNYPVLKVEVLKSLATQEYLSQNLNNAVLTYYEAIELASKNELLELEARLRHNLGYCYSNYKLYNEAQIEYLVADSLWDRLGRNDHLKAMTISNIALNAIEKGDLEFGGTYNNKSIDLLKKTNEPLWLSRAFRVKARYYFKKNNFKTAQIWVEKSDSVLTKVSNLRDQMEIDVLRSKILLNLGELNSAEKYSLKSLEQSLAFKDSLFQVYSYENLEKIEELQGNADKAYGFHKDSKRIRTLLNENQKVQNIVLLRAKMNFEKEKELLRLDNLKKNITQKKYLQLIIGVLLVTFIIMFIVYKAHRREKNLNKQLSDKTADLESREIQMRNLNTTQEKLFSIVGHDLKGPISSLKELLKVMSKENDKEKLLKGLLPKLNNYTDHVHFTLDNLLNWGKNQMKGEHISPSTLHLKSIGEDVIALFSEATLKKRLNVALIVNEEITFWADKEDVNVIFRNLLSNAIKFTHSNGNIIIKAKAEENKVLIEFIDSGVGMSAKTQKIVCDSDQHYSTFGTNNEKGTGLGLMLCKTLVARNNGEISVLSSETNGTTFFVYLQKSKPN